ncbi:bacterial cell division membrane protein [Corynebacterium kutscheri]|uniref:Probable peptidoglycan glycosyltransferase FtsW n=1 Tax=Corynebacterium kutscheri TaxID=35755 RepID=A0A0F6TE60_9CORY|nr:putative peptidoglycan glycosyltransferase FtsW [Corynebacterium kutscheri]AKE41561.1 cell division-specific peptidoglycan biosynthesis regulator FtsW [Corynebacterium kutscheri]VEH08840.1 bacterial cell division membrane protein [Corynebacterium kutscheri]VEH09885.1 bacterial cell division membrane protein [Corynebacterium kutscheri]VEH79969.1 bacterial cell division membrane protein [Corynebacterium kutscheri]
MSNSTASRMQQPAQPRIAKPNTVTFAQLRKVISERLKDFFSRPLSNYYMILICVVSLTLIGVVMVMSASMTWSVADGATVWSTALRQTIMVVLGLFTMWMAMRMSPRTIRRLAPWLLIISIILLIAVLIPGIGTGKQEVGSQSWIDVGAVRFQPSEIARVAIAIWGAQYLSDGRPGETRRLVHFGVVALGLALLIFMEGDAGMAMSFMLVAAVMLFFAGLNWFFVVMSVVLGMIGILFVFFVRGGFRSDRITVYFDALRGHFSDVHNSAYQSYQGFLSLADGSMFGVGLGQSRAKWFYLPESKNDFIYAIIGEELGFFGASTVVVLFGILGWVGINTARKSATQFLMLMSATLTAGVVVQAFINIGYVVGALPVTGIQLPMISAGGTSAVITLGAMGILANCARHQPDAISHMAAHGRPAIDRFLFLPEPRIYNVEERRRGPRSGIRAASSDQSRSLPQRPAPQRAGAPRVNNKNRGSYQRVDRQRRTGAAYTDSRNQRGRR